MDDEQRFLRYAVPGIAVVLLFTLALIVVQPQISCWLVRPATPWRLIALLFGSVIASGGLGFLLAQIYFGLPAWFNTPDHREATEGNRSKCWLIDLFNGGKARLEAQRKARYAFQSYMGETDRNTTLTRSTSRSAQRMAAMGTTILGLVIGFLIWLWFIIYPPIDAKPVLLPHAPVAGFCFFLLPCLALWRARHKTKEDLEHMVREGLKERGEATNPTAIGPAPQSDV